MSPLVKFSGFVLVCLYLTVYGSALPVSSLALLNTHTDVSHVNSNTPSIWTLAMCCFLNACVGFAFMVLAIHAERGCWSLDFRRSSCGELLLGVPFKFIGKFVEEEVHASHTARCHG